MLLGPEGTLVGRHDGANAWKCAFDPADRPTVILLNGRDCSRFQCGANGRRSVSGAMRSA